MSCLATCYVHGKEGDGLKADTENCLVEKEIKIMSYFDQHFVQIMFCGIQFLHEMLLNLLKINGKNKVSYHVFMLLLLAHEVHMRNQEPRTNKSDWSIRISYVLIRGFARACVCEVTCVPILTSLIKKPAPCREKVVVDGDS